MSLGELGASMISGGLELPWMSPSEKGWLRWGGNGAGELSLSPGLAAENQCMLLSDGVTNFTALFSILEAIIRDCHGKVHNEQNTPFFANFLVNCFNGRKKQVVLRRHYIRTLWQYTEFRWHCRYNTLHRRSHIFHAKKQTQNSHSKSWNCMTVDIFIFLNQQNIVEWYSHVGTMNSLEMWEIPFLSVHSTNTEYSLSSKSSVRWYTLDTSYSGMSLYSVLLLDFTPCVTWHDFTSLRSTPSQRMKASVCVLFKSSMDSGAAVSATQTEIEQNTIITLLSHFQSYFRNYMELGFAPC